MPGRVTIKSIARDLGISHMTVSRALAGHPNVQKTTREAVQKRARELGYVKSAAAKMMRGDATSIVGLLLPNIVNEFYARFANAMALACEARSHHLIIHITNDDRNTETLALERLREVQAECVVMVPAPNETGEPSRHLDKMRVIQLIRRAQVPGNTDAILINDREAIAEAVARLADEGHDHIAYVGGTSSLSSGRERLGAYKEGLDASGLRVDQRIIFTGAPSFEMGREAARTLLDQAVATCVVCGGFEISNGVLSVLMERNLSPNQDFRFVGYGDPAFYSWVDGGVSTLQIPVEQLAESAAKRATEDVQLNNTQSGMLEFHAAKLRFRSLE